MNDTDETFARSLHAARVAAGWSQTRLAKAAREHGLAFHQQTVQRIEDLSRPVRVGEAVVLASVLGADLNAMLGTSYAPQVLLAQAMDDAESACRALSIAIRAARN